MDAAFFWDLFLETGAPEAYLFYRKFNAKQSSQQESECENLTQPLCG